MHICKIKLEAVDGRGATFTRMDYEAFGKRRDHSCREGGDIPMIQQLFAASLREIARVLVRFDHVARRIVNANHSIM